MAQSTCEFDDQPVVGRGWCRKHYTRWTRHGDPLHGEDRIPPGTAGVYVITCTATGWTYVGSSASVRGRLSTHKSWLRNGTHNVRAMQADWETHGEATFTFRLVEVVEVTADRFAAEQAYIDAAREGGRCYNPSPMAQGRGYKLTEAQRARLGAAMRGKPKSAEHRANLWQNREVTPEFREQMAANGRMLKGKPKSAETRARMSAAQQRRKMGEPLYRLTADDVRQIKTRLAAGETGQALAAEFGISSPTISQIKNGQRWADITIT